MVTLRNRHSNGFWPKRRRAARSTRAGHRHDYQVLPKATVARFVRLTNVHSPDGGKFSLYDLRVFGSGGGARPARLDTFVGKRSQSDPRKAEISWAPAARAEFYIVRAGIRPDLMSQNYQVYDGKTSLDFGSLNAGTDYYVAIDTVNENGITRGRPQCLR